MTNPLTPSFWPRLWHKILDILLPPLCIACDAPVGEVHTLCPACWKQIQFIAPPFCACCGAPFDVPVGDGMQCGHCINEPPHYKTARAAMLYNDASKSIVLSFKHGDRTYTAKALAAWLARAGKDQIAMCDMIMPVPLHRWRLFKRRYNQSALLAKELGRITSKPVTMGILQRIRATPTQGHLKRKERQDNVRGAFAVDAQSAIHIKDKNILLIDDVLTTGATVNECARILQKAGAKEVHILTLSRVKSST